MQTPLRILLAGDYPDDPRLGSAKVFAKLQCEFRAMGHQCDTITASDLGARPAGRQLRQLVAPALAARAIRRRMQQSPVDLIDAASAEGLWVALARRAGALRTACICRSNGLEHLNYARMLDDARVGLTTKAWWRRVWYPASRLSQVAGAARASDRLLLLTDTDRAFAIARGWKRAECIDVVPHGVDERYLGDCAVLHAPRGSGLLFCATWDHMKGIRYLVDAFALIHEHGRRPNLTVLGPGVSEMDVLHAFPEHLRPFVRVVPRAPEAEVMATYRCHDALVWTSTYEGFGLGVVEAMSQGLPVVATPVGVAATIVRDGETGLRVPVRDAAATAVAIERLLDDPSLGRRLAAAAFEAVQPFTWRRTAEQTIGVYRRALAPAYRTVNVG